VADICAALKGEAIALELMTEFETMLMGSITIEFTHDWYRIVHHPSQLLSGVLNER
jgi:hypothetical protein